MNPFHKWFVSKIKRNKNCLVIVNGPTGCGKTYLTLQEACEIAKIMGTKFSIENNVDFSFGRLLKKMRLPENSVPGACFVFEEAGSIGSGAAATQWQSKANRFLQSFMQTSRCKNRILFFTCPAFTNLQKSSRTLLHMQIIPKRINYTTKKCIAKVYLLQTNTVTGKIYFKLLRYKKDGVRHKIKDMEVDYPPQNIVDAYEKKKDEFVNNLEDQMIEESEDIDEKETKEEWDERLSITKAAKMIGRSYSSLRQHIKHGSLKAKLVGSKYTILKSDLLTWENGDFAKENRFLSKKIENLTPNNSILHS